MTPTEALVNAVQTLRVYAASAGVGPEPAQAALAELETAAEIFGFPPDDLALGATVAVARIFSKAGFTTGWAFPGSSERRLGRGL